MFALLPFPVFAVDVAQFSNCSLGALNREIYGRGFAYVNDEQTNNRRHVERDVTTEKKKLSNGVCGFYPPQGRGESENATNKSEGLSAWRSKLLLALNNIAVYNWQRLRLDKQRAVAVVYNAINIDAFRIAGEIL